MARLTKAQQAERDEAIAHLRELLPPGSTVHTVLTHTSQSGLSRSIKAVITGDDGPWDATYLVARACEERVDQRRGGVVMGGVGMDMGFALVYNLSRVLYPDGFGCIGDAEKYADRCPSNDHSNDRGKSDYSPTRHHNSGGYALRHHWL